MAKGRGQKRAAGQTRKQKRGTLSSKARPLTPIPGVNVALPLVTSVESVFEAAEQFIDQLVAERDAGKVNKASTNMGKCRKLFRQFGIEPNPMGVGNRKTGTTGTYRPVGPSCPEDCALLQFGNKSCYAQQDLAGMQEKRSEMNLVRSLASAACAMIVAALGGDPARLHVSGDLAGPDRKVDPEYVEGLARLSRMVRDKLGNPVTAWMYTHYGPDQLDRDILRRAGIEVLFSDRLVPGGAVINNFDKASMKPLKAAAKEYGLHPVKCPAQLTEVKCNGCRLCFDAVNKKRVIVFDPHGDKARELRLNLPVIQG